MRIGLEMFGTQTEGRHRGVGRYCRNLAEALARRLPGSDNALILYADATLPRDAFSTLRDPTTLRWLDPAPTMSRTLDRLMVENPDDLDVLVIANPLELTPGHDPPARPVARDRPSLAAVVYDLIPLRFPDDYLRRWTGPAQAKRYVWALERLRQYDALLAISRATRDDVIALMNMPAEKVAAIGTGGDDLGGGFSSATVDDSETDRALVRALGLEGPFVFAVAALDPRKNLEGLLAAFARLPQSLLATHKLAVAAGIKADEPAALKTLRHAESLGLRDRVVLTGLVDDATLRALYRRAEAFVFPSRYEGFGLPILEALRCGAAVVAGDNSSQPEAAGDAALLVNTDDPQALALAIERLLSDRALAASLRSQGPAHAAAFTWDAVASRLIATLEGLPVTSRDSYTPTRRLAFFAPLSATPPVAELARSFLVDLFHHDLDLGPGPALSRRSACYDHRLFSRIDRVRPYDHVLRVPGGPPIPADLDRKRLLA